VSPECNPSNRVREGRFGACPMAEPDHVGECVAAMKAQVAVPVTVKCRTGIDAQDPPICTCGKLMILTSRRQRWQNA
jgi:tRNA-dihydrouridine synthase